jgi:hypothetical protein
MAEKSTGRQSPFERVLEQVEEEGPPSPFARGAAYGAERLWKRAGATPLEQGLPAGAIENLYAEVAPRDAPTRPSPEKTGKRVLASDFAEIRKELAAIRGPDQLRRLRRRCALTAHPDRVDPADRSMAEKFMAEINAAIDRAIKDQGSA